MDHVWVRLFINGKNEPIDLWIPLYVTVSELWSALNRTYHLTEDPRNAYLQAENPLILLGADQTASVADTGVRSGTCLYFTNREPVR